MPRGRWTVLSSVLVVLSLILPAPRAEAQQEQKLSEIVARLYLQSSIASALAFVRLLNLTSDDAEFDLILEDINSQVEGAIIMNQLIGAQVSSFPLGSSAGGFSWTFDPALGTFSRVSPSFGPVFSERALTIGRRRLNVGINYQRATFDSIEGSDLRDGDIKYYLGVQDVIPNFDIFFEDSLDLRLTSDTVGLFATYGITDRLDLGIAVPIMDLHLDATLTSRIGTSAGVNDDNPTIYAAGGSARGIGDIVLRAKYAFLKRQGGGLAAGVDWRLPTGDEEELLGIAGAQGKFYVAASSAHGRVSPHFNAGFTVSGDTTAARSLETALFAPPDEWNYAGGIDVAVTDRFTVVGDIVGRTLRDSDRPDYDLRLELVPTRFGSQFQQFETRSGSLNMLLGSTGVKFNPFGRGLIAFNLLFPLNDAGVQDKLTWVGGFEWSF
jgi:Putative MetA-pathway of phenol degradation